MSYRIGSGVDFHQLGAGRKLMIGGVHIPYEKGAIGHSDADVLLHAICDALLGALSLGDIGTHFPDTDERYKNIDSKILLAETVSTACGNGFPDLQRRLCDRKYRFHALPAGTKDQASYHRDAEDHRRDRIDK
jgi:hypothetical protein